MMSANAFEMLMKIYQQIVLEHGSRSEEAENALEELLNIFGDQEMTNEHRQIMAKLGMLPKISTDKNEDQFITKEAWAEWYGVSVDEVGDMLSQRGILATTVEFREARIAYEETVRLFGEDSEQATLAFRKIMSVAPAEFLAIADEVAHQLFDFPQPVGVDENGQSQYSLSSIAGMLGIPLAEAVQIAEDCDINLDQPAKVYRLH